LEISGDVLSTADMVVQRRDGPRRLREIDDDDDVCLLVLVTVRFDSTSYVFLCADAEPLRRNISYVDLDRFSSCRRVSHVDLGPVSPVRKPAEAEAGKSRYSSPVFCIKLEFCIGARAIKVLRD